MVEHLNCYFYILPVYHFHFVVVCKGFFVGGEKVIFYAKLLKINQE